MKLYWHRNNKFFLTASFVVILLIAILLIVYSHNFIDSNVNTFIRADGYYWVKNVIKPFIEDGFSWDQIFYRRGNNDHVQPLTKALYLLNTLVFQLDFKIFGKIGFLSLLMSLLLVTNHYVRQNGNLIHLSRNKNLTIAIIFIFFYFIFFNYNSTVQYGYELILVNMLYSILIPVVFIILLDRYLTGHDINFAWVFIAALVMTFSGSTNLLFLLSGLCTSTMILLLKFKNNILKKRALKSVIFLIVIIAAQKLIYSVLFNYGSTFTKIDPSQFPDIFTIMKAALLALGATVISPNLIAALLKLNNPIIYLVPVGITFLCLLIIVYYFYFKSRHYDISIVPILMLSMYFLTIAGIIAIRGPRSGEICTLFPRYIKHYNLIYIGFIWILMTFLFQNESKTKKVLSFIVIVFFLSINTIFLFHSTIRTRYVAAAQNSIEKRLFAAVNGNPGEISTLPVWSKPKNWSDDELLEVQKFLKDQNLTFFAYKQK